MFIVGDSVKKIVLIISILCFSFILNVKADTNYEMSAPKCVISNNNTIYIPLEFAIRDGRVFETAKEGKLLLTTLKDTAKCNVQSFEGELFNKVELVDNKLYGTFFSNYSDGSILDEDYNKAIKDDKFDYKYFQTSVVLTCTRDIEEDNNYYYFLNDTTKVTVGNDNYCNYINGLFEKEYSYKLEKDTRFPDIVVDGIDVIENNPDILYLVLLVTLILIFFFILLEVKKQNDYSKKRK